MKLCELCLEQVKPLMATGCQDPVPEDGCEFWAHVELKKQIIRAYRAEKERDYCIIQLGRYATRA